MVLQGTTRLLCTKMRVRLKGGEAAEYDRFLLVVPPAMARDSLFPFKPGQELMITVDPKGKIVLEP